MNRNFSAKTLFAAAIAIGALGAATAAQARSDVVFSIGLNAAPYGYVQPAPVYVQPQTVYVQPQPVYYGNGYGTYRNYGSYQSQRNGAWGDADHDGIPNIRDRVDNRRHQVRGASGDADFDGVANRYDRAPYDPSRR